MTSVLQEANLFPFRMKLIVKFFSFEFQHPVYSILYKVSFLHSIACNVDIIQQLHLLLLGNHNENKNTSPRRFQVSSHHWCDKDDSSFVKARLCLANLYSPGKCSHGHSISESML